MALLIMPVLITIPLASDMQPSFEGLVIVLIVLFSTLPLRTFIPRDNPTASSDKSTAAEYLISWILLLVIVNPFTLLNAIPLEAPIALVITTLRIMFALIVKLDALLIV